MNDGRRGNGGNGNARRVLLVDDDPEILKLLDRWLTRAGYGVDLAGGGREALARLVQQRPDLVITDLVMDGMDGLVLLSAIHRDNPVLPVIILSGQAGIADAMRAAHLGVAAFLTKPIAREDMLGTVSQALTSAGTGKGSVPGDFGHGIIHRSQAMEELLERARLVAGGDSTTLISGATGTGKELLARAIHAASARHDQPFVGINCSALPEQLLESELFGHEKGAFSGAVSRHRGLFHAADGGTLFLDEVGDMPVTLQSKLLRVLQNFRVRPVGATRETPVNVRVISATNKDLEQAVEAGEFRADLYYRLNVVPLHMPDLARRREDIPLITEHLLKGLARRTQKPRKRFSPQALEYLVGGPWPGNIRQLENVVEQCVVLSTSAIIPLNLVRTALRDRTGEFPSLEEARLAFERRYLVTVLRTANGNVTLAARLAGRNRTEFYKLLNRHDLDPASFRDTSPQGDA